MNDMLNLTLKSQDTVDLYSTLSSAKAIKDIQRKTHNKKRLCVLTMNILVWGTTAHFHRNKNIKQKHSKNTVYMIVSNTTNSTNINSTAINL